MAAAKKFAVAKKASAGKKSAAAKKAAVVSTALGHDAAFGTMREIFAELMPKLQIVADSDREYTVHTLVASPFKQHKGAPMFFGSVRNGKAYASFHLFPLYMNEKLKAKVSPDLRRRMQGLTCFNFKEPPDPALIAELKKLSEAGLRDFEERGWA